MPRSTCRVHPAGRVLLVSPTRPALGFLVAPCPSPEENTAALAFVRQRREMEMRAAQPAIRRLHRRSHSTGERWTGCRQEPLKRIQNLEVDRGPVCTCSKSRVCTLPTDIWCSRPEGCTGEKRLPGSEAGVNYDGGWNKPQGCVSCCEVSLDFASPLARMKQHWIRIVERAWPHVEMRPAYTAFERRRWTGCVPKTGHAERKRLFSLGSKRRPSDFDSGWRRPAGERPGVWFMRVNTAKH